MTDRVSKETRSWNMSRIKGKDTRIEIKVRKYLFNKGFRYRIHYPIHGRPDIAFPSEKLAIFIHGCFWHKHNCSNFVQPKMNKQYWSSKLDSNVDRDQKIYKLLLKIGWSCIVLWECDIDNNVGKACVEIVNYLARE